MTKKKKKNKSTQTFCWKKIATNKGFYIALCSVVAIASFTIYSSHLKRQMNQQVASFDENSWREAALESQLEIVDIDNLPKETQKKEPEKFNPQVVETSAPATEKTEVPKFSMNFPIDGEIIAPCSVDELVFCESMQDWRTHNGTDIAAKIGDQVKAAESGVISQVYQDDLLGVVVVIDHGNEISSLYGNLQSVDFIKVGTQVEKGDIIGGVGDSGILEASSGPHLHFEVISGGEYKDPEKMVNS
ncbi:MAG: M23 family metallopeptidase [Clostridia bacterium]|nr:M23 family metallopeptidase [Clostridia bacterium]